MGLVGSGIAIQDQDMSHGVAGKAKLGLFSGDRDTLRAFSREKAIPQGNSIIVGSKDDLPAVRPCGTFSK
jgi:hypothetical protein